MDYSLIFDTLLQNFNHSSAAYDKPSVIDAQEFNTHFEVAFRNIKRDVRLTIISDLVGRKIATTYDLKLGEMNTLKQMLKNQQFIADTCAEYHLTVKEKQA